jgi:uncharacterized protein
MGALLALASGLLFGLGLIAGGATDPAKVKGFLDFAGAWGPSLGFVMGGAVLVALVAFAVARRRARAWAGMPLVLPSATRIDAPLLVGGALFGIGWGIAGFCPGPAWVALASGSGEAALFVAAMAVGMLLHDGLRARRQRKVAPAPGHP